MGAGRNLVNDEGDRIFLNGNLFDGFMANAG
jgi:hypothetical protein